MQIGYTNHRGVWNMRDITPTGIRWGATDWHGEQLLIDAFDHVKGEYRSFAAKDFGPAPEHGWVCYNGGPGSIFWSAERNILEHELTDDIRPATAYEKAIFRKFGKPTLTGGYEIAEDHQEELKGLEFCLEGLQKHRYGFGGEWGMDEDTAGEYVTYAHAEKVIQDVHEFAFRMDRFAKTYLRHLKNVETSVNEPEPVRLIHTHVPNFRLYNDSADLVIVRRNGHMCLIEDDAGNRAWVHDSFFRPVPVDNGGTDA